MTANRDLLSSVSATPTCDCCKPLTTREEFLGDVCEQCEREYQLDTHDDDQYPHAA